MLGIIFIYFIGKAFYQLAEEHERSKWGYAILGVLSFYASSLILGIAVAIIYEVQGANFEDIPDFVLNILGVIIGALTCMGFYHLLKRQWTKKPTSDDMDILDEDFL